MKSKAAQYLNEVVSLTILSALVVALIFGQATAESRSLAAAGTADRYQPQHATLKLVVDPELVEVVPPLVEAILKEPRSAKPTRRPLGQ